MTASKIHILVVGVLDQHAQLIQHELLEEMQSRPDIRLMCVTDASYEDAAGRAQDLPELDIVTISNNVEISRMKLGEGCLALARALAQHPNKPWVHIPDTRVFFAGAVFRTMQLRATDATEKHILDLVVERLQQRQTVAST